MTVLSETNKITYIGSLSQTLYPIPFEYVSNDNIKVSIYSLDNELIEDWVYSTQYVIEDNNVKVLEGYEIDSSKKILILRDLEIVQDNKYREGGDFPAKSTELSFDKLTMIAQQHQEILDRCVKVEVLDNQTPDELLDEVYEKLDSATAVAEEAIASAEQAQVAADNATQAVQSAEDTLRDVTAYVDQAKIDINNTKTSAETEINSVKDTAIQNINDVRASAEETINSTVAQGKDAINQYVLDAEDEVRQIAVDAANAAIADAATEATQIATDTLNTYVDGTVKPSLQTYVDQASASASAAAESASNADADADNAAESAGLAATSAEQAHNSEVAAANYLNELKTTATDAFNANAAEKQAQVDASANAAAQSETNASNSANIALEAATKASFGNIGDVKYTLRLDVPNGGVWCDGSLYTKVQFPDVYQMLADNNIHSISITDFDAQVSAYGSCGVFGFDASSETFKVPRLENVYIKSGMAPSSFNAESLPNITGNIGNTISSQTGETSSGAFYQSFIGSGGEGNGNYKNIGIGFDASRSSSIYQNNAKVNPNHVTYRAYVVLYSAAAEESVAAVAGLVDELSKRKLLAYEGLRVIDCLGNVTVQLYDNDEIIRLTINGQSNITFDTSTLNFTKPYYTVQVRFIFPNGVQTVSLQTNEQYGLQWINQSVPDFSSGKTHWIVLRKEISYTFLEASDAGESF